MDVAGMLLLLSITYTLHQVATDIKIAKVATLMVVLVKIIMYMIKMEAKYNETRGYKNECGEGEHSGGGESGENEGRDHANREDESNGDDEVEDGGGDDGSGGLVEVMMVEVVMMRWWRSW